MLSFFQSSRIKATWTHSLETLLLWKEATRKTLGESRNVWLHPAKQEQVGVEGPIRSQRLCPGGRRAPGTQRASPCHQARSCRFDTAPVSSLRVGNVKMQTHRQVLPRESAPPGSAGAPAGPSVTLRPGRVASPPASAGAYS